MNRVVRLRSHLALLAVAASVLLSACGRDDPASLIGSARDYQAKGDHSAAIIQLRNALQKQPENGEARLMLGRSALIVGDALTAEKEFRKALEHGQPQGTVVPLLADAMMQSGSAEKAVKEFAQTKLDDASANAELQARLGEAYLGTGSSMQAAGAFAASLASDPKNVRAQLGQARMKAIEGKIDEATADVDKIASANPKSPETLKLLSQLKLARGDKAGATTALRGAVDASPSTPGPRLQLISLLISDNQFDAAISEIDAARKARAPELPLKYSEAVIAFGRKDLAKARELTQDMIKRAPGYVPAAVLLGSIEFQEKRFDQAAAQLQGAVAQAPDHVGARLLLARSYLASGKPARAVEALAPISDPAKVVDPGMLMLIGEAHFANGDLKQASTFFEKASQSKGPQPMAQTRLAQIAMASGDVEGGVRKLENLATEEGASAQTDMALLTGYLRQGNTAKALEVARGMVKKSPNDPMAHQALGSVLVLRKELPAARAAFAKALEQNDTYMPAVASLAQLDLQEGKTAEARARFEAVLAKEPKNTAALMGLAAVLERARAPSAEIVAVLQRAIAAQPDVPGPRLALINLYLQQRDARAALSAAQEASAALGKDSRILDALGRAQLAAGETNQAIDTFNRLAAAEPRSPVPLQRLAGVYASNKQPERAIDALVRAQKLAPADANIARDLAALYLSTGKNDEAMKQAKALQASAPKSAAGFALEGDVHRQSKQLAAAEKAYRDGLKVEPASSPTAMKLHNVLLAASKKAEADAFARTWIADRPKDVAFRNYLGEQALRMGDHKAAAAQYQAIVDQQPDNALALNNLAWTLGKLGDPKAVGYAERALKIAPESAAILDTLGVLLVDKGETAKGIEHIAKAVQLAPERHDIRLNYAKALLKAGRKDDARRELTQLQGVSQDFPGKSEVAELLKQ